MDASTIDLDSPPYDRARDAAEMMGRIMHDRQLLRELAQELACYAIRNHCGMHLEKCMAMSQAVAEYLNCFDGDE